MNSRALLVLPILLFVMAPAAHADAASDFGRAQNDKNSYEAQREWRQRNVKPIQLDTVPTSPVPDNRPRSSDEINAEQERKMEAMHSRWATKPQSEEKQAALQRARNKKDQEEMRIRWEKTYPRMMKKARKAVVGSEKRWEKFLRSISYEERRILVGYNDYTFHSPLADVGREILAGTPEKPGDRELAQLVWTRCRKIEDKWCTYELGLLEASSGTAQGLEKAISYFKWCQPSLDSNGRYCDKGEPICAVELARAYAFGLGVPVDTAQARESLNLALRCGYEYDVLTRRHPNDGWMQYQMLLATLYHRGIVYSQDVGKARAILTAVVKNPNAPMPWRAYLMLLEAGGDIDDKALSSRLLAEASAAGRSEAAGYMAAKNRKDEGVPATSEQAPARPMGDPGKASEPLTANIEWISVPSGGGVAAFELAKTEVTNKQYRTCVMAGACTPAEPYTGGDEYPVVNVDWDQAKAFCAWSGGRLPTEKEWEHAAQSAAGSRAFPWGDAEPTCDRAVIEGCAPGTAPVCSKPAGNSVQGVCDMAGNVQEWTLDWFSGAPADSPAVSASSARVFRGGAWNREATQARTWYRDGNSPGSRALNVGFRPAR